MGTSKKRLLLTGAAGFVGSHVLRYLLAHTDYEIICLIRLNFTGNLNRIKDIQSPKVTYVYHDLKYDINESIRELIGHVDYIFHIGANSHVDRSILHPKEF